ncbi:puratrophin-1-like isoform X5 [Dermacentor albipictus]|uniref:puratrophin-1-like isoform X5 n=1 Tax=Dermacentor albipictus TaxID=60249 RepID=UPI0038FC71C9
MGAVASFFGKLAASIRLLFDRMKETSRRLSSADEDADSSEDETEDIVSECTTSEDSGGHGDSHVSSARPGAEVHASDSAAAGDTKVLSRTPSCRCPRSEAPFSARRLVQSAGLANDEVPCICCSVEDTDSLGELQVQQTASYGINSVSVQSRLESSVMTSISTGPVTRTVHVTTTVSSVSPVETLRGGFSRRCINSLTTVCVPRLVDRFNWQPGRVHHGIVRQPSIRRRSGSSVAKSHLASHCLSHNSSNRAEPELDLTSDERRNACSNESLRVCNEATVTVKELAASLKDLEEDTDEPIRFFFTAPSPTLEHPFVVGAAQALVKEGHSVAEAPPPSANSTEDVWRCCSKREDTGGSPNKCDSPVPKVPERPTDLPSKKRAQDVGRVTTEVLSSLYEPFVSVRSVILRQASEVCSCKYFGDVHRFRSHFLLPVAHLLRLVKTEVQQMKEKAMCSPRPDIFKARPEPGACCDSGCPGCPGLQSHQAWPLCFSRRVAIQLCELDSSVLRPGDFYLAAAVGPEDPARVPGTAKLVLKYRDDLGHLCSRRIDAHDLGRLLAMDWTASGQETDEQLVTLLKHLLVSVERGLERIEWDSLLAANKTWASGHRLENCPCKNHASLQQQQQPDDANDSEGPTGHAEPAKDQATGGLCPCSKSSSGCSVDSASRRTSASSGVDPGPSSSDDSSSREGSWAGMLLPGELDGLSALFRERTSLSREEEHDDGYCDNSLAQPTSMSQLGHRLLLSRVACFPGCRDVNGRGIAIISSSAFKDVPELTPTQLAQMLMYFYTIPKKEISVRGFLLLVDAADASEQLWKLLDEALCLLEANINNAIDIVVVVNAHGPLEVKGLLSQTRAKIVPVTSQEKLLEFVDKDNLLPEFGGTYAYDHQEWMSFRKFLEPFVSGCRLSGRQLVSVMQELRTSRVPPSSALALQLIDAQKRHIQDTFRDEQLRHLQEEGDTILQELQAYRARSPHNLDYRDALEKSGLLYNELKRAMAKLTKLADKRLQRLQECMLVRTFEEESSQVLSWICKNGAEALSKHFFVADSLSAIQDQEYEFEKFYFLAMPTPVVAALKRRGVSRCCDVLGCSNRQEESPQDSADADVCCEPAATQLTPCSTAVESSGDAEDSEQIDEDSTASRQIEKGNDLLEEVAMTSSVTGSAKSTQELAVSLKHHLECFTEKLEDTREKLEDTSRCYLLLDHSYEWALDAMKFVSSMKMDSAATPESMTQLMRLLQDYQEEHPAPSEQNFSEMLDLASKLDNPKLVEQCKTAQARCRETAELMEARHATLLRARQQLELEGRKSPSLATSFRSSAMDGCSLFPQNSWTPGSTSTPYCSFVRRRSIATTQPHLYSTPPPMNSYTAFPASGGTSVVQDSFALDQYIQEKEEQLLSQGLITDDLTRRGPVTSISRSFLESRSKDGCPRSAGLSALREKVRNSLHKEGHQCRPQRKLMRRSYTWQLCEEALSRASDRVRAQNERLVSDRTAMADLEGSDGLARTLLLVMREMVQTERDYVKSLAYIIENYIPELMREDIPQALRGQRNVVFGNIEKIYEFHSLYFLQQLEQCESCPFMVGQCFLQYEPQFYLYALYNKNKPKSDSLMSEYGNAFFKQKQLELGDKMDLASYLLKPVQRMGKYALLLKQILKECPEREPEHADLKAAEEMVRFQLRHGNDLLGMDALRECDVNVKEQGRLLRQDEFLVWQGRSRKSLRHVFLFEDLILFSKVRRDPEHKGHDIYQYKHSIKTTDIGLTEQIGESPTKFEIWFRKRKLNDVYLLQAPNPEVKRAWVHDISKLLWKQALRNREMRLAEMSSMGIGNKPCLDIRPSSDQINDRSITFQQLSRTAPRLRSPLGLLELGREGGASKRPHSIISVSSSSSSSSSQGSLHCALNLGFEAGDSPRPLQRSLTHQSHCSTESGFCTDASTAGDCSADASLLMTRRHRKAERSDSLLSNDSLATHSEEGSHCGEEVASSLHTQGFSLHDT